MKAGLVTLAFGALFGFVLGWARLHEPAVIDRMLRLVEPDVFLLMGSAIVTAAIGTRLLRRGHARTWLGGEPVSWKTLAPRRDHVVGSVLFGIGWSIACTCPGPAAVQIGRGEISGLVIGVGMMLGIALRDATAARATAAHVATAANESPAIGL